MLTGAASQRKPTVDTRHRPPLHHPLAPLLWTGKHLPGQALYGSRRTKRTSPGGDLQTRLACTETNAPAPWGLRRMTPLHNGSPSPWRYAGIDPATQMGRWIGEHGAMTPAELGKHGTSVNTYPPTQVGKDGKVDADSGHDATQD
ncbi:putative ATP-grasp-modified RiPP [Streptomyces cadmiisoli]|uniref:putative ATP-grasp-modified RiPP n=1 Tax=Streptomyces cadmiisoli TaxID=2184053 RepID=UPI0036644706